VDRAPRSTARIPRAGVPAALLAALVALLVAGCTGGALDAGPDAAAPAAPDAPTMAPGPDAPTMAPGPGLDGALPPEELAGLTEAFAAELAATGTRLTRASLIDRESGSEDPDPNGTHLALYLEPPEGASAEDYLDGMVTLTLLFAEAAFDRYPGLASFDVCQVPHGDIKVTAETPFTLVDVTRAGFATWRSAGGDLAALHALSESRGSGVRIAATAPVRDLPTFVALRDGTAAAQG
jgi:hypothetical protein